MSADGRPVSVVCVFNDEQVRADCLDRSVEALRREVPGIDYVPVDNTAHRFPSAGAALTHGASLARNDVLVFVHQDVYLHSAAALGRAAAILAGDGGWGVLGAIGIAADGGLHGRIRDRVVLLGAPAPQPVEVDSVDEVLFMVTRDLLAAEPLASTPELAWHAYAVEYGLRARARGLRVGAVDLGVTHNSLTINLARLDEAHAAVARAHPGLLPVRTTCGTVTAGGPHPLRASWVGRRLEPHRWRYRWLRESWTARAARRALGGARFTLGDVRRDIDARLAAMPAGHVLHVVHADPRPGADVGHADPLDLTRRSAQITVRTAPPDGIADLVATTARHAAVGEPGGGEPGAWGVSWLITNLDHDDVGRLVPRLPGPLVGGFHEGIGCWLLSGPAATTGRPPMVPSTAR